MNKILVVDDDQAVRLTLSEMLSRYDYDWLLASSGAEAIREVEGGSIDIVLLDLIMPDLDGMGTLCELKRVDPEILVIMITGGGDIDAAVRAIKLGAHDFITKPLDAGRLMQTMQRALDQLEARKSVKQLEMCLEWTFGNSAIMRPVIRQIRQSAWSDAPLVIEGETGTGKSVAGRLIHNLSRRADMPFQTIKTMSESLFEEELFGQDEDARVPSEGTGEGMFGRAKGGTILLDGLGHIPLPVQARLARIMAWEKAGYPHDLVVSSLSKAEFVGRKQIRAFLDTLWYPLYFLDFETVMFPIPPYDGMRPYQQLPFQYSLHYIEREGGDLRHHEYLAEPNIDPRAEIAQRLVRHIPKEACVIAYNASFEIARLNDLAEYLPRYRTSIKVMIDNVRDLIIPFRKRHVYYWQMKGSASQKAVLPALVPEMGYEGMEIAHGGAAMDAYFAMCATDDPAQVADIRAALLKYCKLDTLGMVRILEKLKEMASWDSMR